MVTHSLEGERLVRRYGARTVLDIEHISVRSGEVLAIVGPNGAGKSTLFRTLLLLEPPDAGVVRLNGQAMRRGDVRARGRIAGVFQRPVLFSGTVRENVMFGLHALRVPPPERTARTSQVLESMQLDALADASVHRLSGGEAQRVALARALVLEPDVLLLDEPTASLDAAIRRQFRDDMERVVRQRAGAIVLITHDAAEAFALADRVAVLHDGSVVQAGRPDDLVLRPATPFIAELTGAELLLEGTVERIDGELILIRIADATRVWAVAPPHDAMTPGRHVVVGYRPEDVMISVGAAAASSALNVLEGIVADIVPAGALMRVRMRVGSISLVSLVTRQSVESLGLAPESPARLHLKAAALHAWPRGRG